MGDSEYIRSYNDKNKFIRILKKLYKNGYNVPFDNKKVKFERSRDDEAQKYLDEIQNFPKLIKNNKLVLEEFSKLFTETLGEYLKRNR